MTDDQGAGEQSTGLRERKKQVRRAALHEAALRLVERQGLEGDDHRGDLRRGRRLSAHLLQLLPVQDSRSSQPP